MSVHYKFKSALEYDTVTFDGLHISIADLKASIIQQKRIGKTSDFDLQITNAQTKEVYSDGSTLIPKNTSLLVARIPVTQQAKKSWDGVTGPVNSRLEPAVAHKGTTDLSRMEGSEEDKIMAMMSQSTLDYDPSNYQKIRGANQRGEVPPNYRCYRCHEPGHWIKNCPLGTGAEQLDIKRSTGIPRSFMVPVEGPSAPGAMITPTGAFAVPAVDHEAYQAEEAMMESGTGVGAGGPEPPPRQEIPDDLICSLCRDLLTDAVMIPCCGNSFCDECIRGILLESEDHECPDCREKDISPVTLIPNRFLRNSVASFRNQTGYCPRSRPQMKKATKQHENAPENEAQTMHGSDNHKSFAEPKEMASAHHNGPPGVAAKPTDSRSPARRSSHEKDHYDDSDGSYEDNITVTVPSGHSMHNRGFGGRENRNMHQHSHHHHRDAHSSGDRYMHNRPHHQGSYEAHSMSRPPLKPPGIETPPIQHHNALMGEERSGTPTIDEREHRSSQMPPLHRPSGHIQQGPNFPPMSTGTYPSHPRSNAPYDYPPGATGPLNSFQPMPHYTPAYQPLPPGSQPTPGIAEDPLEAFERMIREKEEKARRRDKRSRTRSSTHSRTRSRTRSRYTRSRSRSRMRSRTPFSRSRSRSRAVSGRSPVRRGVIEKFRSYSRSPVRRAPPPPVRRRSRDRRSNSFSASRSRSPRSGRPLRRRGSPTRYRSPLRTPPPQGVTLHQRPRYPSGSSYNKPSGRSDSQERVRLVPASVPPRPQRHFTQSGYGAGTGPGPSAVPINRYNQRNNAPPAGHPSNLMTMKMMPPGMEAGPRMRYGPSPFEDDVPPGTQPPPPGFEHPPLDRREEIAPPGIERGRDRERQYREQRPPFRDAQNFKDPQQGFRDGPNPSFRDGPQQLYRENMQPGFRDHPSSGFRDVPPTFRDGPPGAFRDGQPSSFGDPNFREGFRDAPQNLRERPPISQYRENLSNYRDNGPAFRDVPPHMNTREGPQIRDGPPHMRDNANHVRDNFSHAGDPPHVREANYPREGVVHKRSHRESHVRGNPNNNNAFSGHDKANRDHGKQEYERNRDYREQERPRDGDRRDRDYERNREERYKDYDKNRDASDRNDREKEHGNYFVPEKRRRHSASPRRDTKDDRSKVRNVDSRGRSRESQEHKKDGKKDHDKDKKFDDEKVRDRDKKIKDKKKKKKEKDEKRKRREKRDKKDKVDVEKSDKSDEKKPVETKIENKPTKMDTVGDNSIPDLYNDISLEEIDKNVMETYVKDFSIDKPEEHHDKKIDTKEENFETKSEITETNKEKHKSEVLAPFPELSKWEVEDEQTAPSEVKERKESASPIVKTGKVTSEVLKRAENAIFAKAINAIRPIEIKKISLDRVKLYSNENTESNRDSKKESADVHATSDNADQKLLESNESHRLRSDKTPPPKLSVKERLGGKIDEPSRRNWEEKIILSTVERIKSRSRTPQSRRHEKDTHRRITVDSSRDKGSYRRHAAKAEEQTTNATDQGEPRKEEKKAATEIDKRKVRSDDLSKNLEPTTHRHSREEHKEKRDKAERTRHRSESEDAKSSKKKDKRHKKEKDDKKTKRDETNPTGEVAKEGPSKTNQNSEVSSTVKENTPALDRERKKSCLDEASFEPDYDENVESETEGKESGDAKKVQSKTPEKTAGCSETSTIQLELANWKKRTHSESSSSSSESSSSSSSSGSTHKRRRKKRNKIKKKKQRQSKDSASESENTSSDEPKKKKKKRKAKKKAFKKKKKSKHK